MDFTWNCTWISQLWILNVNLGKIWPCYFFWLKKTWLEPKFEVCNSKNTGFGIMVHTWILPGIVPKICSFWILNVILSKIWPHHFNGLQKTWLEPKFEVSNSKNTNFGIMVPGFYLGLYLKYAVFEFLTSSWVKSDPPIFTGSQNHGCSQNFMHLSQETQILE